MSLFLFPKLANCKSLLETPQDFKAYSQTTYSVIISYCSANNLGGSMHTRDINQEALCTAHQCINT